MLMDTWKIHKDLDVIIGDGCSRICRPVSLLAAVWNIPVISYGCQMPSLSNKTIYPTFSRVTAPGSSYVRALAEMVLIFGWKRVAVLNSPHEIHNQYSLEFANALQPHNVKVFRYKTYEIADRGQLNPETYDKILNNLKTALTNARIIFILTYSLTTRILAEIIHKEKLSRGHAFLCGDISLFGVLPNFEGWIQARIAFPNLNAELWQNVSIEMDQAFSNQLFANESRVPLDKVDDFDLGYGGD